MTSPKLALIDLDGTLVDSVPDLAWCVDQMLATLGLPKRGEARVREWVGNGAERLVRRALLGAMDGEPDPELFARAFPLFMELYGEHTSERSRVYPGVREGLEFLAESGVKIACVTNKPIAFAERLLRDLGLYDHFALLLGGDSLPKQKPDPMPLLHAADHFGVTPADAVLIGDSVNDVSAARAAGYRIICVSYGYNHGRDIREAQPDAVIDSLAELGELLSALA